MPVRRARLHLGPRPAALYYLSSCRPRARLVLALTVGLLLGVSLSVADAGRPPASTAGRCAPRGTSAPRRLAIAVEGARLLAEVMQRVRENYVDPVDDHKLMQNAIRGMVEALDDHSTFLTPDEFEDMKVSTSGAYAGIGVEVVPGKDGVSVVRRMANRPPSAPASRPAT